ncbi:hypothetical protein BAE44_0022615 [Dichanthelium oligosanthes]|uniref:Glabrous enhancer-binding protein-like DBD domain-containing protein n=1 Tax=Dichanthelium oligosanthes TaxID=888268 RepID=A0A1E5UU81_9POAL|nr:hypothetical protein BAE44_0022615 [Dichanthelium oligosanthes]
MAPGWPNPIFATSSSSSSANSSPAYSIIVLSDDEDDDHNQAASSQKRGKASSSSFFSSPSVLSADSNHGPVVLSDDDDGGDDTLAASNRKRRAPIYRSWQFSDEVNILTELAAERRTYGELPTPSELLEALLDKNVLKRENPKAEDVSKKMYNLKNRFKRAIAAGGPGNTHRDTTLYDLSVQVWPDLLQPVTLN